jgi:hypothetical protein
MFCGEFFLDFRASYLFLAEVEGGIDAISHIIGSFSYCATFLRCQILESLQDDGEFS